MDGNQDEIVYNLGKRKSGPPVSYRTQFHSALAGGFRRNCSISGG